MAKNKVLVCIYDYVVITLGAYLQPLIAGGSYTG